MSYLLYVCDMCDMCAVCVICVCDMCDVICVLCVCCVCDMCRLYYDDKSVLCHPVYGTVFQSLIGKQKFNPLCDL